MGCSQSKANDVVIEPITAPPSECGKPSMDLAFTDIIVDHDEETSTSVPPPVEEEVSSSSEEEESHVEEEEITPDVEVEPDVEAEEIPAAPAVVEEEAPVEPEIQAEEVAAEPEVQVEEEEAPMEPEVEAEDEVELEKSSVVDKSTVTSVNAPVWTFKAVDVAFTVGIAFFSIAGTNSEGDEVHLTKRYSEFKLLHAEMAKVMGREELPSLPAASWLQGRNDKTLLEEREAAFVTMLNAIAVHPEASQSAEFNAFLV